MQNLEDNGNEDDEAEGHWESQKEHVLSMGWTGGNDSHVPICSRVGMYPEGLLFGLMTWGFPIDFSCFFANLWFAIR